MTQRKAGLGVTLIFILAAFGFMALRSFDSPVGVDDRFTTLIDYLEQNEPRFSRVIIEATHSNVLRLTVNGIADNRVFKVSHNGRLLIDNHARNTRAPRSNYSAGLDLIWAKSLETFPNARLTRVTLSKNPRGSPIVSFEADISNNIAEQVLLKPKTRLSAIVDQWTGQWRIVGQK